MKLFLTLAVFIVLFAASLVAYRGTALYLFHQIQPNAKPFIAYRWQGIEVSDQAGDASMTLSYFANQVSVTAYYLPIQHLQFSKATFQLHGSVFWPMKAAWKQVDDPWYRRLSGVKQVDFKLDNAASQSSLSTLYGVIKLGEQWTHRDHNGLLPMTNAYVYIKGEGSGYSGKLAGVVQLDVLNNPFPLDALNRLLLTNPAMWGHIVKEAFNQDADELSLNQWLADFSVADEDFDHHVMPLIGDQHSMLKLMLMPK
jgi:hypothetical protein